MAYISRTEPHRMFLEVNSSALITKRLSHQYLQTFQTKKDRQIVKPGRIKTTPAEEIEL